MKIEIEISTATPTSTVTATSTAISIATATATLIATLVATLDRDFDLGHYLGHYRDLGRYRDLFRDVHLYHDFYSYIDINPNFYVRISSKFADRFDKELDTRITLVEYIEAAKIFKGVDLQRIVRRFKTQQEFIKAVREDKAVEPPKESMHETWLSVFAGYR